jgi:hypothetical protein
MIYRTFEKGSDGDAYTYPTIRYYAIQLLLGITFHGTRRADIKRVLMRLYDGWHYSVVFSIREGGVEGMSMKSQ